MTSPLAELDSLGEGPTREQQNRIRRAYMALEEMQPLVESLDDDIEVLKDKHGIEMEWVENLFDDFQKAKDYLTGTPHRFHPEKGTELEQTQERLLTAPILGEPTCEYIQSLHKSASHLIRYVGYQTDPFVVDPGEPLYREVRRQAIQLLGLADVILLAVNPEFVRGGRYDMGY